MSNEELRVWYDYMLDQGLVGDVSFSDNLRQMMSSMCLTDKGFEFLMGKDHYNSLTHMEFNVSINPSMLHIG